MVLILRFTQCKSKTAASIIDYTHRTINMYDHRLQALGFLKKEIVGSLHCVSRTKNSRVSPATLILFCLVVNKMISLADNVPKSGLLFVKFPFSFLIPCLLACRPAWAKKKRNEEVFTNLDGPIGLSPLGLNIQRNKQKPISLAVFFKK